MSSLAEELRPYAGLVANVKSPSLCVGEDGFPFEDLDLMVGPRKYLSRLSPVFVRAVVDEVAFGAPYRRLAIDMTGADEYAQNSLLKFVEDTPIDITLYTEASYFPRVLPTVLSRTFRLILPPAPIGLLKAVLRLRGVSEGTLARIPAHYTRSIADAAVEFDIDTASRVAEVLRALEAADAARAFQVSRGFDRACCRHLNLLIRTHLSGDGRQPGLARGSHETLSAWAEQLMTETIPPGLATRWGILEVLSG